MGAADGENTFRNHVNKIRELIKPASLLFVFFADFRQPVKVLNEAGLGGSCSKNDQMNERNIFYFESCPINVNDGTVFSWCWNFYHKPMILGFIL